MNNIPEHFYTHLREAVERTLDNSDLVQNAMNEINTAGYDVTLSVWARAAQTEGESIIESDPQLDLFQDEDFDLLSLLNRDPLFELTRADEGFLRALGITHGFDDE
jgi:hypothetical protein